MPCTYDYSPQEIAEAERAAQKQRDDIVNGLKSKLNLTTRLLCEITSKFDSKELSSWKIAGLAEWCQCHAEMDAKRKAAQQAKKAAKQKAKLAKEAAELQEEKRIYEKLKKKYG